MTGRAPLAQLVERHVGGLGGARRGLKRVGLPAHGDLLGIPRPTGEDGGRRRHAYTVARGDWSRYGLAGVSASPEALGMGLRGRAALPRGGHSGRRHTSPSRLGFGSTEPERPVPLSDVSLPPPRLSPPELDRGSAVPTTTTARSTHTGAPTATSCARSAGVSSDPPDVVAHPRDEDEVRTVLDWAVSAGAAVIPFGGGTSVVGGCSAPAGEHTGVVTVDLKALDRVLEVDPVSLSARIQAGATGPRLEEQLGEHGLTLRHFPQSFQFSTLGGWIATRAGGHFATVYTHIDDLVESVRALTPVGAWESRRLPGSGAGVSPDRMLLGSEGTLGVITEAWMRVRPRPTQRASAAVQFDRLHDRRRRRPSAVAIGAVPDQLPADRPRRGRDDRRGRRHARAARARIRVRRPRRRAVDVTGAGVLLGPRRKLGAPRLAARRRWRRSRRSGRELARGVPARAVSAGHADRDRDPVGDVRDGDHVGSLRGVSPDGARARHEQRCAKCAARAR